MRNALFTLVLVVIFGTASAQDVVFQTLATKGTCMVQRGTDPDEYENLKTGTKLYANDKIIITGDESYLGLVSTKGNALELAKGGVYDVNTLKSTLASKTSSVAEKYVEFLVQDMSKTNESTTANMKFTGSVERSLGDNDIELFLPKESKITKEMATMIWYPKENQDAYKLSITNMFEESVFSIQTEESEVDVDFKELSMEPGETYLVKVSSVAQPTVTSGTVSLHVPSQAQVNAVTEDVNAIRAETPEGSAIQEMVLAKYYEENELYVNAIPHFQNAIELQPDVTRFREAYNEFLFEIGLRPRN